MSSTVIMSPFISVFCDKYSHLVIKTGVFAHVLDLFVVDILKFGSGVIWECSQVTVCSFSSVCCIVLIQILILITQRIEV